MPAISVCIPVYTMKDNKGERFLVECLSNLVEQSFKDFEVVVSDQCVDDKQKQICDSFSYALNIKHVKNNSGIHNAANNVNNALRYATGDIIKLLYVDDFFVDRQALEKIKYVFDNNEGKWLIGGFVHCNEDRSQFYDQRVPWYGNAYVNGDNTTGNPSNYSVRRECALEMDENLKWIVDGEYFYRSYYHFGMPLMVKDLMVCFRDHGDSAFKDPKYRELDTVERRYCVDKYNGVVDKKLIQYVNT